MKNKKRKVVIIYYVVFIVWIIIFLSAFFIDFSKISQYHNKVFYNTYIDKYNISGKELNKINELVNEYSNKLLSKSIILNINGKEYVYKYKDLNIEIDKEKLKKDIIEYNANLNFFEKTDIIRRKSKKIISYNLVYNQKDIEKFVINLKPIVDQSLSNGKFVVNDNREVSYVLGTDSFSLNIEQSTKVIMANLAKTDSITLVGSSQKAMNDENYKLVNTKVSSFSTEFNPYISRATNLTTALNYIDGVIVNPGEIFSFHKYAGPYNKKGYVFYYEFVGNGVCQIATTVYNAALLGGLEIVKRYPHAKKSVYVDGGLDATVASYASGWYVDFQFKNTYQYPIYISAYAIENKAYVDFWSNSNAKEGKTYTTESVQMGTRYYNTYLHTFENGVEIDKKLIASTWYTED